jgi:hypothetical protein
MSNKQKRLLQELGLRRIQIRHEKRVQVLALETELNRVKAKWDDQILAVNDVITRVEAGEEIELAPESLPSQPNAAPTPSKLPHPVDHPKDERFVKIAGGNAPLAHSVTIERFA